MKERGLRSSDVPSHSRGAHVLTTKEAPVSEDYAGRQIVGMDLHRRRSVLVRMTEAGERLETVRIVNDPDRLAAVMARAGKAPEAVLEATYGWYWAADTLPRAGCLGASGASVGRQGLLLPPGEKRRTRRGRSGRPVADGPTAGGLDRAAGAASSAPAGPASRQAGRAALERHLPGACGAGRLRSARDDE